MYCKMMRKRSHLALAPACKLLSITWWLLTSGEIIQDIFIQVKFYKFVENKLLSCCRIMAVMKKYCSDNQLLVAVVIDSSMYKFLYRLYVIQQHLFNIILM